MSILKKILRLISTFFISVQTKGKSKNKVIANFPCKLTENCFFGYNVHFNGIKVLGDGKVYFGNNFHSGKKIKIITTFHNYDNGTKIPYDNTFIIKDVHIEDNVWIGDNVLILGGITIHEGAVIQAGSVVVRDVEYCAVVGGAPAQKFKIRDIKHYELLKERKDFF